MKICHVSSEFGPVVKVGGLGEVVYGLSKALVELNHEVEVILPFVPQLFLKEPSLESATLSQSGISPVSKITVLHTMFHNIRLTFLTSENMFSLFNRSALYGYEDDVYRFIVFCKTVKTYLSISKNIELIHLHDWHTSLLSSLLKNSRSLSQLASVLTVHSFAYQGICPSSLLQAHISNKKYLKHFYLEKNPHYVSLLKGSFFYSDYITTVSPFYAKEMLHGNTDEELKSNILLYRHKFKGILNGIDTDYWNPATDPLIYKNYFPLTKGNGKNFIAAKESNKTYIRNKLRLQHGNYPLVIVISRLVHEKGLKFIIGAITETVQQGGQIIILGSCFDKDMSRKLSRLKKALNSSAYINISLGFSESLAHLLYAAADISLVPSLTEPCGLTQLISMRYGTLPLVRHTGGLADTVKGYENGFVFYDTSMSSYCAILKEAIDMSRRKSREWRNMITNAMNYDANWIRSAKEYENIYKKIKNKSARIF